MFQATRAGIAIGLETGEYTEICSVDGGKQTITDLHQGDATDLYHRAILRPLGTPQASDLRTKAGTSYLRARAENDLVSCMAQVHVVDFAKFTEIGLLARRISEVCVLAQKGD
jgi:type IV secretory pathway ATPase VirB11/archaellum biosynthesis ATPase